MNQQTNPNSCPPPYRITYFLPDRPEEAVELRHSLLFSSAVSVFSIFILERVLQV